MQISRSKASAVAVSLFLMLAMAVAVVAVPLANAHDPAWTFTTFPYLVVAPDPVGVGQTVAIMMWIDYPLPGASVGNDIRRHDYKLTITAPDDSKEVMTWDTIVDTTGVQYVRYTPDQTGTYTLLFEYPKQVFEWGGAYQGDIWNAASKTVTLTVQEDPIETPILSYPLPTEYWTRPIEGQNTDWYAVSSNWLGAPYLPRGQGGSEWDGGQWQRDGIAPNSPHVMWSRPIQDGGVVGGNGYDVLGKTYYMGGSYNVRFSNPLIMYGRLYYELPWGNSGGGGGWICVDLRTGEEIWSNPDMGASGTDVPEPSFGYLYSEDDPNQHGVVPCNGWLFSNNFADAIDPATGRIASLSIENVPYATTLAIVPGQQGELLRYVWNDDGKWLAQWNSSKVFNTQSSGTRDASTPNRYDWNVSLPTVGPGSWTINRASYGHALLLTQGNLGVHQGNFAGFFTGGAVWSGMNITGISLKPEEFGRILWTKYFPTAPENQTRVISSWDPENDVFITFDVEERQFIGWSLKNGEQVWGPTESSGDFDYFRWQSTVAYGRLYHASYGGILYCYDTKNGSLLWTYGNGGEGNTTYAGQATAWGHYPIFVDVIADGKVYLATTEHSPNSPFYKGSKWRCVNATTGEEIWTLSGWGTGMDPTNDVIADGFFVFLNCYDMKVYSVGKGPSSTTVKAPDTYQPLGKQVLVTGSVMDIAAGTQQNEQAARFPNGVPAVSDENMGAWMEYVYMQKPKPTDAVGVPVTITVIDPNNNIYDVGTATSDASGFYSCEFTPEVPGKYTIIATFAGSESFWPSQATTAIGVEEAPEVTPEPTPTPAPMTDMYVLGSTAGIIIAIVVVGLLLLLMLRRR
jgi:outer membrane protein assembly factor BamB